MLSPKRKCSICKEIKDIEQFEKMNKTKGGRGYRCVPCKLKLTREQKRLRRKKIYDNLFIKQNGLCAICNKPEIMKNRYTKDIQVLAIDHNHETGKIRGLLCMKCNTAIGRMNDDPELLKKAANYLESYGERMDKQKSWGYHLLMDMSGCTENINNPLLVKKFLEELVVALDMKPIGGPTVVYVDWDEGKGVSGVQLITTSTITFHGDDDGKCVYLDVFSCKEYEPDVVFNLVKRYFEPQHIQHKWILRDAPKNTIPC